MHRRSAYQYKLLYKRPAEYGDICPHKISETRAGKTYSLGPISFLNKQ